MASVRLQLLAQPILRSQVKTLAVVVALIAALVAPSAAFARIPPLYKNCTALNRRYPHGVGRVLAGDKTSGTPVTTFRRSHRHGRYPERTLGCLSAEARAVGNLPGASLDACDACPLVLRDPGRAGAAGDPSSGAPR
jgi:hypothetical protein